MNHKELLENSFLPKTIERPKSIILICELLLINILVCLISVWIIPYEWRKLIPLIIWCVIEIFVDY